MLEDEKVADSAKFGSRLDTLNDNFYYMTDIYDSGNELIAFVRTNPPPIHKY